MLVALASCFEDINTLVDGFSQDGKQQHCVRVFGGLYLSVCKWHLT